MRCLLSEVAELVKAVNELLVTNASLAAKAKGSAPSSTTSTNSSKPREASTTLTAVSVPIQCGRIPVLLPLMLFSSCSQRVEDILNLSFTCHIFRQSVSPQIDLLSVQ